MEKEFRIAAVEEKDIDLILEMCSWLFSEAVNEHYPELFFYCYADFSISLKAMLDEEIIGCYLLNKEQIEIQQEQGSGNLDGYAELRGLQGVALGIRKEYRGHSFGRQLRDSVLRMTEYDYVWGYQVKTLNNLEKWIRSGRRLVGETESSYVTLMDLHEKRTQVKNFSSSNGR
jgi:GNAT superfamily N-acetyltransferase